MSKFIITGTGRCGTTYVQAILRVCGVNCGHQNVFTHETTVKTMGEGRDVWEWGNYDGDSSFMAVPLLPLIRASEPDTKIILLYRDVHKVSESWLKLGLFKDDMQDKYPDFYRVLNLCFPDVLVQRGVEDRALLYWRQWNGKALEYCDIAINIDFLTECPEVLFHALGIMNKLDKVLVGSIGKNINSYKDKNRYE